MKILLVSISLIFAVPAFAGSCIEYSHQYTDQWFSSAEAACRDWGDVLNKKRPLEGYGYIAHDKYYCLAWTNGPWSPMELRSCENKCSAKKGNWAHANVLRARFRLTSLDSGAADVQWFDLPAALCNDGCEVDSPVLAELPLVGSPVEKPDAEGYHPVNKRYRYTYTGNQCTSGKEPLEPPKEKTEDEEKIDKDKCDSKGGYFGQINGKDLCLGEDKEDKCLPGQTYGQINGKDVCLSTNGDLFPRSDVDEAETPSAPASGPNGSPNGKGSSDSGTGKGDGKGGSGGGSGGGTGKGEGEGDKDEGGTGPSFGDQPGLYEPRYKNGIKGVWEQKKGQLQNTGLGQLSRRLMPSVNSGSCPSWQLDLNLGSGLSFGSHKLQPPCSIWPILRAIVLVCALILARKLVFGG